MQREIEFPYSIIYLAFFSNSFGKQKPLNIEITLEKLEGFYFKCFQFMRGLGKWKRWKLLTHRIYQLASAREAWITARAKLENIYRWCYSYIRWLPLLCLSLLFFWDFSFLWSFFSFLLALNFSLFASSQFSSSSSPLSVPHHAFSPPLSFCVFCCICCIFTFSPMCLFSFLSLAASRYM